MIRYGLLAGVALLAAAAVAWAQGTGTNPVPGSVWTWLGPTYGAGWVFGPQFVPGGAVDPIAFGADPTGVQDSAPAIRQAIAASANVRFSPGTYSLCSTQASPYPAAMGPSGVLVQNKSNFAIDFGVAQFKVCDTVAKPQTTGLTSFMFDKVTNYTVTGGTFIGNQPTSTAAGLTAGICTANAIGARYINQTFTGDWQSTSGGSGFCGDYIVNSLFSGMITQSPVTVGYDLAFLQNVRITGFNLTGQHGANPGNIGVSIIYDTPMLGQNTTGYTIADSSNVTIDGTASGFGAGWFIAAGSLYQITGNYSGNVGNATQSAWGGIIGYNASGSASSVGHPPTDMMIGGRYDNNGNAVDSGGGILIENSNIANSDVITGIKINAAFYNNNNIAVQATTAAHLSDIQVSADCRGNLQIGCLSPALLSLTEPSQLVTSVPVSVTSNTTINLLSIALPAGKWAVSGQIGLIPGTGTMVTSLAGAISQQSLTFPCCYGTYGYAMDTPVPATTFSSLGKSNALGQVVFNLGTPTTIYLVTQASFSGGTAQAVGTLLATRI